MTSFSTIKPKRLRKRGTIGVVTPSEPIDETMFDRGVHRLQSIGFSVVTGEHVRKRSGHLAGSDAERAQDIMAMFMNPEIDAIVCSAGGANSGRLLPLLDYEAIRANPKILLGMSDPTALILAIHARTGLVTFHGPVVQYDFGREQPNALTETSFGRVLVEARDQTVATVPDGVLNGGSAQGALLGGNLTTLQQLVGTPYEPNWDGAILFWEDVFEQPHVLDAKLTHLCNAGVFERISGMIVGELVGCEETDYPGTPPIEEIVLSHTKDLKIPILRDVQLGHGECKLTLPLGVAARIDTGGETMLTVEAGCVR